MNVTIVDYGSGNVLSVRRALEFVGGSVTLTDHPDEVLKSERIVLPGVGAFGNCMDSLKRRELLPALREYIRSGRPFLGICVGMQILMDTGYEFGTTAGLGVVAGDVVDIPKHGVNGTPHKIPHIGWSAVSPPDNGSSYDWDSGIFRNLQPGSHFYFVHSMTTALKDRNNLAAVCDYDGCEVTAAVSKDNVVGVQFHPEKSASAGLSLLGRFLTL